MKAISYPKSRLWHKIYDHSVSVNRHDTVKLSHSNSVGGEKNEAIRHTETEPPNDDAGLFCIILYMWHHCQTIASEKCQYKVLKRKICECSACYKWMKFYYPAVLPTLLWFFHIMPTGVQISALQWWSI